MGLIKAIAGSIGGTLHDQWKEVIACENMDNETLMVMKTTPNGVISKGSAIRVAPGQCAVIVQEGKALDATAEEGTFTFDESTSPTFFAGDFGDVFKEMWNRFTYGGGTQKNQVVFFFNTKEILDNKFGTKVPVMYTDWSHPVPNGMTGTLDPLPVKVRCFGKYTFKITDPAAFMTEIAGTASEYKKSELIAQMQTEVADTLNAVLNSLGKEKYPVLELPSSSDEIKRILNEKNEINATRRGVSIVGFNIEGIDMDEESDKYIKEYVLASNANMQQGKLVGSYSKAMEDAANNANGAANGFMGLGMLNMTAGGAGAVAGNVGANVSYQPQNNNAGAQNAAPKADTWKCSCGAENTGKFCNECGKPKPQSKFCSNCGAEVSSTEKFCHECGTQLQ